MKIVLRWVGKTKNPWLARLIEEYQSRIRHFSDLTFSEVKPTQGLNIAQSVLVEGSRLLSKVDRDDYLIALDPLGQQIGSERFAEIIDERREHSLKKLVFVLGGAGGLSSAVKSRCQRLVSLSSMTFNHEMARLILVEQIYRALTLINQHPYHK